MAGRRRRRLQRAVHHERTPCHGRLVTDRNGEYRFWAVTPTPYPIPHEGPVCRLLEATSRTPMRAPYLQFVVRAEGLRTLVTHIFVSGDPTSSDRQRLRGQGLARRRLPHSAGGDPDPDGRSLDRAWSRTRFDIVLAPAGS